MIRALATGDDAMLRRLAVQPLDAYIELALVVSNPEVLTRFTMSTQADAGARIKSVATMCAVADLLPPRDADRLLNGLADTVIDAGRRESTQRTDLAPAVARALPDDYVDYFWVAAAPCRANGSIAAYFVEAKDGQLPWTSWIPRAWSEDKLVGDLLGLPWDDPNTDARISRLELPLEALSADRVEALLAAKGDAAKAYPLDVYRAYRRVATRANFLYPVYDEAGYLVAMRRGAQPGRPYVFGDQARGGGVSGIATVRIEPLEKTTRFHVRLDQKAYYRREGLADRRSEAKEWEFYPFVADRGRRLINAVKLAKDNDAIPVTDIGADANGGFLFEAPRLPDDMAGIVLEVDLAFFDQTRQLVFELYDRAHMPIR